MWIENLAKCEILLEYVTGIIFLSMRLQNKIKEILFYDLIVASVAFVVAFVGRGGLVIFEGPSYMDEIDIIEQRNKALRIFASCGTFWGSAIGWLKYKDPNGNGFLDTDSDPEAIVAGAVLGCTAGACLAYGMHAAEQNRLLNRIAWRNSERRGRLVPR